MDIMVDYNDSTSLAQKLKLIRGAFLFRGDPGITIRARSFHRVVIESERGTGTGESHGDWYQVSCIKTTASCKCTRKFEEGSKFCICLPFLNQSTSSKGFAIRPSG